MTKIKLKTCIGCSHLGHLPAFKSRGTAWHPAFGKMVVYSDGLLEQHSESCMALLLIFCSVSHLLHDQRRDVWSCRGAMCR